MQANAQEVVEILLPCSKSRHPILWKVSTPQYSDTDDLVNLAVRQNVQQLSILLSKTLFNVEKRLKVFCSIAPVGYANIRKIGSSFFAAAI